MKQSIALKGMEKNLYTTNLFFFSFLAFFINISTSISNIFAGLALVSSILLILQKKKLKNIIYDVSSVLFITVFLILFLRTFYDFHDYKDNFRIFMKYRELILFPFLALSFNLINQDHRKIVLNLFIASAFIVAIISILAGFGIPLLENLGPTPFSPYIFQGIATSMAIYFSALLLLKEERLAYRIFYGLVIILGFIDMFYFVHGGRTGYICLFALVILLGYRLFNIKGVLLSFVAVAVLFGMLYTTSNTFKERLITSVEEYKSQIVDGQIQEEGKMTSTGLRLEFWHNSLTIIQHHPFFGAGTGNYPNAYEKAAQENEYKVTYNTNPHQDFLMLGAMIGIPGILLYIFALLWMIKKCNIFNTSYPRNYYSLGVVITLIITSLFNSPILDSQTGNLFLALLSMTYLFDNKSKTYD